MFKMKKQLLQVLEIILLVSMLTVNAQFMIKPKSVVKAVGLEAVFECLVSGATSHGWFVNGLDRSSSEFPPNVSIVEGTSGNPSLLTIPASSQFNNSVVQCVGFSLSGNVFSRNVTLTVEQVAIDVMNDDNDIIITVTNNFTTDLTYQLDVTLDNIIVATMSNVSNQFNFTHPNHSFCDIFSFSVTPTSMGMEGNSSKPIIGFFTRTLGRGGSNLVSENGANKFVTFTFTVPNCATFTYYKVVTKFNIERISTNGNITDPSFDGSLDFPLPTDQRGEYTITLTDENNSELVFENIPITTFDVQKVFLFDSPDVGVTISIEYAQNSRSPGALVCVLPRTNDGLDFLRMQLVVIPRNASNNFSIPLPEGEYSFVVFDLENENGNIPRIPTSQAADMKDMFVNSDIEGTTSLPPSNKDITVTVLSNEDVQVICPQPLNCLVLVQSLASLDTLHVWFIESFVALTVFSLDTVSNDNYMVVYSWGSEQSIFNGRVSHITLLNSLTVVPTTTESPTTNPPGTVSQSSLPIEATAGIAVVGTLLLILIVCVGTTLIVMLKMRKRQYKGPESERRVDWSSTLSGIEQSNEAYGINEMLKKNIAYEQTKTGTQRQRMDHSPVLALTEGGEYEDIQSVHQYKEVLPRSQMNTVQYVNINL